MANRPSLNKRKQQQSKPTQFTKRRRLQHNTPPAPSTSTARRTPSRSEQPSPSSRTGTRNADSRIDVSTPPSRSPARITEIPSPALGSSSAEDRRKPARPTSGSNAPAANRRASTPYARNYVEARSIEPTPETIERMLRESEQRISKHIEAHERKVLAEFKSLQTAVAAFPPSLSALKTNISNLKLMLIPSTKRKGSLKHAKGVKKRTMASVLYADVLNANPTLDAELDITFETDLSCLAGVKAITEQMTKFITIRDTVSVTSRVMNAFLYGKKNALPKAEFKAGIGLRFSEFRYKITTIMVDLAKGLPDALFTSNHSTADGDGNDGGALTVNRKPAWLTSGIVSTEMVQLAKYQVERVKAELPPEPRHADKRKGLFIAKNFMSVVTELLRLGREKAKSRMCEDGMFSLYDWNSLEWFPADIGNPELNFQWPEEDAVAPSTIEDCATGNIEDVRASNCEALEALILQRKEMLIEVLHDVHVTKKTSMNSKLRTIVVGKKPIRSVISILRIAKSFVCELLNNVPEDFMLCAHPAMLQTIYRFALVLRQFFEAKIDFFEPSVTHCAGQSTDRSADTTAPVHDTSNENEQRDREAQGEGVQEDGDDRNVAHQEQRSASRVRNSTNNATRRKGIPALAVEQLIPSESERNRILENAVRVPVISFDEVNVPRVSVQREPQPENPDDEIENEGDGNESVHNDGDDMSDMMGEEE